ncbi:uncharacterized protein CANTADRAFT_4532 [Suhomyces tanzawaensis NRRL Y-17324]|uniref:Uncharacterized protein n=1 Tax=Suhomyces tanzawaensis NRRL Y-17324 TaxID=984487 RepID=A0A1E4SLV4_9ASCO|nr:uncharacterized protein CANTADRAFT_4532 [Suhomyces tanzawaensis NRRL Y-17324]ODV80503.1 hypothetical protein CANTADRAFT_4532 [Suhomyces tanzawaensis NRRL Y-17324]
MTYDSSIDSTPKATDSQESEAPQTSRLRFHGHGDEIVIIDNKKYFRHELMEAFAGTLNPGLAPYPKHQFGNASAVGLASFAMTTFVLGLYTAGAQGVKITNVVVGLTFFYGGVVQFLAGVWEMVIGNTFAATAFVSYGSFWLSYGAIFVESFGIAKAYADDPVQMGNAVGFFLLGWAVFTFIMLLLTLKSTVMFIALFLTLDMAFILLAVANMTGSASVTKAGGIFCVITACCGWYCAFAGVATKQNSYFIANPIQVPVFG